MAFVPILGGTPLQHAFALSDPRTDRDEISVLKFGARGDGRTKDTHPIQKAIDQCSESGGGIVYFPSGRFLSGSLRLRSGVELHLSHGAVLVASPDAGDFEPYEKLNFKNDADQETSFFHHALI
jgi:polygalacturonase